MVARGGYRLVVLFKGASKEGKFKTGLQDFLICIEMAIAAIAHVFVFSAKPHHFVPTSVYEEITAQKAETTLNTDDGDKSAVVEKVEAKVEVPGTSVTESVQDIVVEGGREGCSFDHKPGDRTSREGRLTDLRCLGFVLSRWSLGNNALPLNVEDCREAMQELTHPSLTEQHISQQLKQPKHAMAPRNCVSTIAH
ncbi:hypothetical protein K7X08_032700 [Anisodus acutangulus]|uniref:Uncharacterized protein n=1 Tax=Anisodus acutangulus TaxID=402998 RepID=A0A9Q1RNL5_9SOLA|nr:hypothetical protein K7X08_032700 [Anisodus acutangulus]